MPRKFAPMRSLKAVLAIAAAGALLVGCTSLKQYSTSDNWPTAMHDPGRGNSTPEKLGAALVPLWQRDIAPVQLNRGIERLQLSSPVIYDGVLYVGSTDKRLYAFNLATGRRLWRFDAGRAIEASPTVTDTKVCFGSAGGLFRCLDKKEGRELWSFQARSEITASALAAPGLIYLYSSDDRLYALNSATGDRVWVYSRLPFFTVTRRIISSPASDTDGKVIYQLFSDGMLVALNSASGKVIWKKQVIKDFSTADIARRTPIVDGKRLYIIDGKSAILTLNSKDGTERGINSSTKAVDLVLSGNRLLVAGKKELTLLDRTSLEVKWSKRAGLNDISTLFVAGDKLVLISAFKYKPAGLGFLTRERGYIELISLDNGSVLWGKRLKGTVSAAASAGNGALALLRNDGLLSLYTSK